MLITSEAAVPEVCSRADTVNSLHSVRAVACLMNTRHAVKLSAISESHVRTSVFKEIKSLSPERKTCHYLRYKT